MKRVQTYNSSVALISLVEKNIVPEDQKENEVN